MPTYTKDKETIAVYVANKALTAMYKGASLVWELASRIWKGRQIWKSKTVWKY